jgi:hypothetical protein
MARKKSFGQRNGAKKRRVKKAKNGANKMAPSLNWIFFSFGRIEPQQQPEEEEQVSLLNESQFRPKKLFDNLKFFLKKRLPGVGSKPGSSQFHLFSHFHHFTAEPQRLPKILIF